MPVVEDKGNWRSQLNSKLANIIANVLGQRVNYTIRYYRHRGHLPNFKHPKESVGENSFINALEGFLEVCGLCR